MSPVSPEAPDPRKLGGAEQTRLIVMGGPALTDGFRLIGFEAYPDATPEDVERCLAGLIKGKEKALVLLEHRLAEANIPSLNRVRMEYSRIVVTELPELQTPTEYRPRVEELVRSILGARVLEENA
jgi:vacuolar-type H+-ATPase subunit F/Vma7